MPWLHGASCDAAATLGWALGGLASVILASGILVAITLAPRLREGDRPAPRGNSFRHWLIPSIPALAALLLWSTGLAAVALEFRPCYTPASAVAAAIVAALPILVLIPLAAIQIARRSIW